VTTEPIDSAQARDEIRQWWDEDSHVYDDVPNHALSDPLEAAAWRAALVRLLPSPGARVLDAGAGTGAISILLAELGFRVTALDLSEGMLDRARRKAKERALEIEFVQGSVEEPPVGPFDAVVERHVLWTTLAPQAVLEAWRRSAPGGRLVLLEGLWGGSSVMDRARASLAHRLRAARGDHHGHHGEYDPALLERLPLARQRTPRPLLRLVAAAGWSGIRIERLRDVEWARQQAAGPVLGVLQAAAQFAVAADDSAGATPAAPTQADRGEVA
jgi:ubiquinone/menaquinone biosynthesis C-methylase UbiE